MQHIKRFLNPINLILSFLIKLILRKIFFNNIENKDFNNLFSYTLDLLPNETLINLLKLLLNIFRSKSSDLFKFSLIKEVINHSIPSDIRAGIAERAKIFFILILVSNILKRIIKLIKNLILLPFKLGVYSFIAYLFGIKVDWLLSFFDILKFNLPSWTYNKLLELYLSWILWFKNTLQIKSINTDLETNDSIPKIFSSNKDKETTVVSDSKADTYLYLTKKEWLYVAVSSVFILAAYFGYTGGIPFSKTFDWSSGGDNRPDDDQNNNTGNENRGDLKGKRTLRNIYANPRGLDFPVNGSDSENNEPHNTWQDTFTDWTSRIINKINPYNWFTKTDVPNIDNPNIADQYSYEQWKKREANDQRLWLEHLNKKENENNNESSGLDKFIKAEQLKRHGQLSELERDDLRKEYLENKDKTSPTHPDPETAREYEHLFQYNKNKIKSSATNFTGFSDLKDRLDKNLEEARKLGVEKARLFIDKVMKDSKIETLAESSNSRDSSETVRPLIKDTPPVTSSESDSEVEHTYPPQPWTTVVRRKPVRFSMLAKTPFAKGYTEKLDTSKPPVETYDTTESGFKPNPSPSVEVEKGSVMFSARFADSFQDEWRDDQ